MTRDQLIKNWDVIEAFKNGAEIECINLNREGDEWSIMTNPLWASHCSYRVKQHLKLVPLTFEDRDLLRGKYLVSKKENETESIVSTIKSDYVVIRGLNTSYYELMERYTFLDGSPCGKMK